MKYVDTLVSFSEIPDEITLCINISQCPNNCKGCHSPWLREDVGEDLNIESLIKAQGFEDCVAYLDGESAKIVVKTDGLDKAKAAAIKEVILGETEISAENIRIFEVK
jgi:pyruvate-formate lyase-activating enzyme